MDEYNTPCSKDEPHMFHSHEGPVTRKCSGLSACGVIVHREHTYTKIEKVWCPGVCNCSFRSGKHGPGEHK